MYTIAGDRLACQEVGCSAKLADVWGESSMETFNYPFPGEFLHDEASAFLAHLNGSCLVPE